MTAKRKAETVDSALSSRKRFRSSNAGALAKSGLSFQQQIVDSVLESGNSYNKIAGLLEEACNDETSGSSTALCTIFCHLFLQGRMKRPSLLIGQSKTVSSWLWERYGDYKMILMKRLCLSDKSCSYTLAQVMNLIESEVEADPSQFSRLTQPGTFQQLIMALMHEGSSKSSVELFIQTYTRKFLDVQLTALRTALVCLDNLSAQVSLDQTITFLQAMSTAMTEGGPSESTQMLFQNGARKVKSSDCRRRLGEAWLSVISKPLSTRQRKRLLALMSAYIIPSLSDPTLLLDFLSDSCDRGGGEALMALSGLKTLVQCRGLDYPLIYKKLYSVLDATCLHRKQRPQLMRLLNSFLMSTHLPATLVASFVKRMSRLSLYAPPTAVVATMPMVYNLIKEHPACAFMLHRVIGSHVTTFNDAPPFGDPFIAGEADPNLTRAIDSSLWELDTLRTHWHPNVAAISNILAQQFLKRAYNLDDFLDHSYSTLLGTGIMKPITVGPAVEYQIPKCIFTWPDNEQKTRSTVLWSFDGT